MLGDSIFDNHAYVHGGRAVIEHVRSSLPSGWQATLLARDGTMTAGVVHQLDAVPDDASQLVVSAGGNDALEHAGMVLYEPAASFSEVMSRLAQIQTEFRQQYRQMLGALMALDKPTMVCTVYDTIPTIEPSLIAALSLFNDAIVREANCAGLAVLDLRQTCTEATDYAGIWPIEPSEAGGAKIARAILRAVTTPLSDWPGCRMLGQ
ncbi:MAG TPA: SGNH/GDSL hydrolase family protein [Pirellulales bacterium]|nr:SGNH/GDSL hydrolase family protein [Pirellulales bacterium]